MPLIDCPACQRQVSDIAASCPACGHPIRAFPSNFRVEASNPGIAALLSLIFPGAGQIYLGDVISGLCWFAGVSLGYLCLILPGLALHAWCIISAANQARDMQNNRL